ncbi:DoxX family protein [Desmospora activa]|uniref:DoxX-like protein n=1 Tax=Desmospora activa DSM 45169 TaxID=1121389 RepID=A0A2T4Z9X0_9BACL|nr:DoxX family protein [Desmospora activa]PTM58696.1 DoxX-like protein [Desmospora activa DSM 45169]
MTKVISKSRLWTANIMSGVVILFMVFDSVMKFVKPAAVVKGTLELGYGEHHIAVIGTLGLLSTVLYTLPRTSVLGAIMLTGYFGGAVATQIRMDYPLFSHTLFPVYIAILAWGGIWLRDNKVRELFPFRT